MVSRRTIRRRAERTSDGKILIDDVYDTKCQGGQIIKTHVVGSFSKLEGDDIIMPKKDVRRFTKWYPSESKEMAAHMFYNVDGGQDPTKKKKKVVKKKSAPKTKK
jgi:hypothetical protein